MVKAENSLEKKPRTGEAVWWTQTTPVYGVWTKTVWFKFHHFSRFRFKLQEWEVIGIRSLFAVHNKQRRVRPSSWDTSLINRFTGQQLWPPSFIISLIHFRHVLHLSNPPQISSTTRYRTWHRRTHGWSYHAVHGLFFDSSLAFRLQTSDPVWLFLIFLLSLVPLVVWGVLCCVPPSVAPLLSTHWCLRSKLSQRHLVI